MRVHDAMSIAAAERTNGENLKDSKFLRICSLFYTILGIGIIRWGDRCFIKITIVLRLLQMYFFYVIIPFGFETLIKIVDLPNNSYPTYIAYITYAIFILTVFLLLLQGFIGKNNIERHADDIEKIDKKFFELSLAHQSKVHYYMHALVLAIIGLMIFTLKLIDFFEGEIVVITFCLLWSKSLIVISIVLFHNCVYDVRQRFRRINELCSEMGNQEAVPLDKIRLLRKLKILHIHLSKHVLAIVRVHRIPALVVIIRIFTIFTMNLMTYIRSNTATHEVEVTLVFSTVEIILFLLLCNECTNAAIEANSTTHYIYGIALKDPVIGLRMEVLNFVSYLHVQKVQFNPYGCGEINNRLIVFILTALITHVAFFLDINTL